MIPYLRSLAGPSGRICAFDLSPEMVKQANQRQRTSSDIVIRADVHQIPFDDNAFERVICFAAFPHFEDQGQAVGEMGRVLRPGGELIIAHLMSREELARHHAEHASVARDLLPDDHGMRAFFMEARLSSPKIVNMPGMYVAKGIKNL